MKGLQTRGTVHAPTPVYQTGAIKSLKPPLEQPSPLNFMRQNISSRSDLPLNTHKHVKHGCLRCPSMTAFIAGPRNERAAVQRDNATSGAIITQVCGWDEGSKKASATGVPLRRRRSRCQKKRGKNTGFISARIKCGLRINEFLNTQHHLHKKQQAGYVGGLVCSSSNVSRSGWKGLKRPQTKQSKNAFQAGSTRACRGGKANGLLKCIKTGAAASAYW